MRTVAAAAIAVIIGAVAFQTVFGFVDGAWNGTFMDWLAGQFLDHHNLEVFGVTPEIVLDNGGVKYFFLQLGICVIVAIVAVGAVSWRMASRRAERRAAAHAAELLGRYMSHDLEAHEAFPEGYEELALVASDVKRAAADQARRLEDESARRSDLITYLAHDLKTPLTSVIGYLSLIDEVPDLPAEQRCRYVGITLDKALRLEALINEFFDITRYGLAHIELELAPVDLSFLLVQMADEFLPALSAHGNRLVVTVEGLRAHAGGARRAARDHGRRGPPRPRAQQPHQERDRLQRGGDEHRPSRPTARASGWSSASRTRARPSPPTSCAPSSTSSSASTSRAGAPRAAPGSAWPSRARSWSFTGARSLPRARRGEPRSRWSCRPARGRDGRVGRPSFPRVSPRPRRASGRGRGDTLRRGNVARPPR